MHRASHQIQASTMVQRSTNDGIPAPCHGHPVPSHAYWWNGSTTDSGSEIPPPPGFAGVARFSHAEIHTPPGFEGVTGCNRSKVRTPHGLRCRLPNREAISSHIGFESAVPPRSSKGAKISRPNIEPEAAFARPFAHADRLHDTGAASKKESRWLAMDSNEDRAQWKTGIYGYRGRKPLVRTFPREQQRKDE